jgi:hypothetical protein
MADMIIFTFRQLVTEMPVIVVCIGCIVAAFIFWKRAPSASLYVVLGCGLTLVIVGLYPVVWWYVRSLGIGANPIVRDLFSICISVGDAAKIILLVVAAYIGRGGQPNTALEPTPTAH